MSPPIRDGSGNSIGSIRLGDGSEIAEVRTGAGDVLFSASSIPDSVVSRPSDNNVAKNISNGNATGARITTDVKFPSIGGKISSNTTGVTKAQIYRVSDGNLRGETDISNLSSGDTFVVSDVNLKPHDGTLATTYNFVLGGGGGGYDRGFFDSASFNIASADGRLRIISEALNDTGKFTSGNISNISRIGDVGFP